MEVAPNNPEALNLARALVRFATFESHPRNNDIDISPGAPNKPPVLGAGAEDVSTDDGEIFSIHPGL